MSAPSEPGPPRRGADRALRVGLVYETFESYPRRPGDPVDVHVEYEPLATIEALEAAVRALGHESRRIGEPRRLLDAIGRRELPPIDVALNIAEGFGSRNREGWVPSLLEIAGIPYLGSDALTLSLSLDKAWANAFVAAAGIAVAPQCVLASGTAAASVALPGAFPLFVKPRWEGASKGIRMSSRVEDRAALVREVERIVRDYAQPALVEVFLPGAEYTVTVVGNAPPRALAVLQRALESGSGIGLHAVDPHRTAGAPALEHHLPGDLSPATEQTLQSLALHAYCVFECRDFARVDFRLDPSGAPVFLEINPLPTFAPDGSFGILAELAGRSLPALLADVIQGGLLRLGLAAADDGAGRAMREAGCDSSPRGG